MTDRFTEEMNKYFGSVEGAYTEMTGTEINKMTYNVKAIIRDLLIDHLGSENIPRANETENQTILFHIEGEEQEKREIQCKFSKQGKNEMTIYLDSSISDKCYEGDVWYVYFKDNDEVPYLGCMGQLDWCELFPQASNEDDEVELDNDDLNSRYNNEYHGYPMYNINVEKGFFTVYELKRKFDRPDKRIIIDADFQRESVWKPAQKAELIESILMGLPLPIFYFNQDKKGRLIVIDGRQRLTALFEFMSDKWQLRGLKVIKELNNKKFSDLDPIVQSQIEDYQIQAHVIQPPTPDRIKFDIFDRVNRAGTQLNKQEIRNALYQGKSTELLKRITSSKEFELATDGAFKKDSRMKGKYIVLRFIALEMFFSNEVLSIEEKGKTFEYKNDMDSLLGAAMDTINDLDADRITEIEKYTIGALEGTYQILGENSFRLIRNNGSRSPINMNVFEVVMHIMKKLLNTNIDSIRVKKAIEEMKQSTKFADAIGNHRDNINKIKTRYEMADAVIEQGVIE